MSAAEGEDPRDPVQPLHPEPLLAVLDTHHVDFIVVGGYAVAAHGFPRATKDIDICPDPSSENLARLADALSALDAEPLGLDDFLPGEFERRPDLEGLAAGGNWVLATRYGRLDLMQHLDGLGEDGGGWTELRPKATRRSFLGHQCFFCGYEDLIAMKSAADRAQDRVDVATLRAARHER
jgi:hypothetical protein